MPFLAFSAALLAIRLLFVPFPTTPRSHPSPDPVSASLPILRFQTSNLPFVSPHPNGSRPLRRAAAPSTAHPISDTTAAQVDPLPGSLPAKVAEILRSLGGWAPVAFIGLFVATTVLCIPGALLTLAGGFLFGPSKGFVLVWIASLIGASAAFGISRHLARDWILRRLASRPLLLAIEQAVSEEGWKIVALSRLAPGSPFFLLNYLYGLTRVRFRDYFWATAISMIPGSFLLVYLGSLGQLALAGRIRSPFEWALYGVGLLALACAVTLIARRANRVLKQKLSKHPPTGIPDLK